MKKFFAEFFGTFWLVFGGCGTAIFAADVVGVLGVALAFGLTVLTMAYAVGHISGGHFNPAVSIGLVAGGKFDAKELPLYIGAQVLGALLAGGLLYLIASGRDGFAIDPNAAGAFAANGYGDFSPGGFGFTSALVAEVLLTALFLIIILGSISGKANGKFAGIAIGLALTLIHLISIPITNTSVNPARSTSQALIVGGEHLTQLWFFWVAPIAGGVLGGIIHKVFLTND